MMKIDLRKQAVTGVLIKDNTADWKNIANKEIEEKNLAEPVTSFTAKMPVEIDDDNKWPINFWGQFTVLYLRSNKIAWKE